MIKEDLTGRQFGRLTVLKEAGGRSSQGYVLWICQCNCEDKNLVTVSSGNLKSGKTKSCGCLGREQLIRRNKSRERYSASERESRLYRIWGGMNARTTYESQKSYKDYGARGIRVCDEWKEDYMTFKDWALSHGYKDNLSIDRLDNDGDYTPDNCRWATRKEQHNNQRSNILLSYDGQTHTAAQWAEIMNIPKDRIYKRIRRGRSIEDILKEYLMEVE